jgi:5-hydroxyisourate hydrolase-like protein (transthyretin family)
MAEELIRGVLWFQPAIWWLLNRIQSSRENVVDCEVVKHTQAPKDYIHALLEVAGKKGRWEMSLAPLFMARRHLVERIRLILQNAPVSPRRLVLFLATSMVFLTFLGGLAIRGFPMRTEVSATNGFNQASETGKTAVGSGSISGRVTIGSVPAAGIRVCLYANIRGQMDKNLLAETTTSKDGRYSFPSLPPGNYRVMQKDPRYVMAGTMNKKYEQVLSLTLGKGEKVDNFDFALIKGGIISGRVAQNDGKPPSDMEINLSFIEEGEGQFLFMSSTVIEDEQGNYRFINVPPGRYIISVGGSSPSGTAGKIIVDNRTLVTYYPNVTDRDKAKFIELAAGAVVDGIDVVLSQPAKVFGASGRVVDSKTGAPVANMEIKLLDQKDDFFVEKVTSWPADSTASGEYHIDGLMPGRYAVYAFSHGYPNYYSRSVPFEIVDKDLRSVDIKALPGATILAQTKVEENSDPAVLARLMETSISVDVEMLDKTERLDRKSVV